MIPMCQPVYKTTIVCDYCYLETEGTVAEESRLSLQTSRLNVFVLQFATAAHLSVLGLCFSSLHLHS